MNPANESTAQAASSISMASSPTLDEDVETAAPVYHAKSADSSEVQHRALTSDDASADQQINLPSIEVADPDLTTSSCAGKSRSLRGGNTKLDTTVTDDEAAEALMAIFHDLGAPDSDAGSIGKGGVDHVEQTIEKATQDPSPVQDMSIDMRVEGGEQLGIEIQPVSEIEMSNSTLAGSRELRRHSEQPTTLMSAVTPKSRCHSEGATPSKKSSKDLTVPSTDAINHKRPEDACGQEINAGHETPDEDLSANQGNPCKDVKPRGPFAEESSQEPEGENETSTGTAEKIRAVIREYLALAGSSAVNVETVDLCLPSTAAHRIARMVSKPGIEEVSHRADDEMDIDHAEGVHLPPAAMHTFEKVAFSALDTNPVPKDDVMEDDSDTHSSDEQIAKTVWQIDDEEEDEDANFQMPHADDTPHRPPLSLDKLVICALLFAREEHGTPSMTLQQIINKIKRCSTYYRNQGTDGEALAHPWTKNVEDILHQYDFPTVPFLDDNNGELHFSLPKGGEWFILNSKPVITPSKGKGKTSGGRKALGLLDIPFELRLMIYTFVLQLPLPRRSGWSPSPDYTLNRLNLYSRYDRPPERLTTIGPGNWELRTRPIPELLALTMVSRQLQQESMPVFYRTNTFYFSSPKLMGRFLSGIPNRRKWVRNLVLDFKYPSYGHECKRSIGRLLTTRLRNLHLIVDEERLVTAHAVADIRSVPGAKFLAELSGLDKVSFQGTAKNLRRFLAAADITSAKKKEHKKDDTDEEQDAIIERKRKEDFIKAKRAFNQRKREHRKAETQAKRDEERARVRDNMRERAERKRKKEDELEQEREAKRQCRARDKAERRRTKDAEKEEREERKVAQRDASARKKQAAEDAKAERREAREARRAARSEEVSTKARERKPRATQRIMQPRMPMRKVHKGTRKRRSTEMATVLRDEQSSSNDDDATESDSAFESDSNLTTPRRKVTSRRAPVRYVKCPTPVQDESDDSTSNADAGSEDESPPARPKQQSFLGGSIKAVANGLRRSSGTGGAPKGKSKVSPAQKLAAMSKSLQIAKAKKGISG